VHGEGSDVEREGIPLDLMPTYNAELLGRDDFKELDLEH